MKGMDKILRGFVFYDVLIYCEDRGEKDGVAKGRLIGGNMSGTTVHELMAEFVAARRLRPDIEKATWHNSLRLPPGDHLDDSRWDIVVADYIQLMGFSPLHPYCIWVHDDESGVHIVASRIGFDGSLYLGQNENLASTRHIQDLERAHGLRLTKGPEYQNPQDPPEAQRPIQPDRKKPTKPEIDEAVRTGIEPPKVKLQRLIDAAVADAPSVVEMAERLESEGVMVVANLASTGTLNGFNFGVDGAFFKGSQLGSGPKGFAWRGLQARGVSYEQDRDRAALERFSATARKAAGNDGIATEDLGTDRAGPAAGENVDAMGAGIDRSEPPAADADAGPGGPAGAHHAGVGCDPAAATGAGSAAGQARGRADPGHDGVAIAAASPGRAAAGAATTVQPGATGGAAGEGGGGAGGRQVTDAKEGLTADHRKKIQAWSRQHEALQAPAYRVSLVGRTGSAEGQNINLGKARKAGDPEKTYTAVEVEGLIPQLRWRNARGFDVYITPLDSAHHYVVVDDMKAGASKLLTGLRFAACLVQSSSKGNEQAVIKVAKVDRADEQQLANRLVQQLNQTHGDPRFSGAVHPFRMAGFSNKKPDRRNAVTRILEAGHRICARASDLLQQLRQAADSALANRRRQTEQEQIELDAQRQALLQAQRGSGRDRFEVLFERDDDPESDFRRAVEEVRSWVTLRGLAEDASRLDYRAATAMLNAGWTEAEVRVGMLTGSDRLVQRHHDPDDYVRRTVRRAGIELATRQASAASVPAVLRPKG